MPEFADLAYALLAAWAIGVTLVAVAYERHRRRTLKKMTPPILPPVLVDDPYGADPTALATLRHAHQFGPKDSDGVRTCRCGDRYLDAIRRG